jgi:outer membrane protein OmpA-like peptidoglycan-associated protein
MLQPPVASSTAQTLLFVVLGLLAVTSRAAEPSSVEQRAREDLDRQLQALVKTPPPEVVISFEGLPGAGTNRGYKLVEADFSLNGQPLAVPSAEQLSAPGQHRLAVVKVEEGSFTLVSRVTYANAEWNLFSQESGFLWKLTASVTFQVQKGLRVRAKVMPSINATASDPRLKLKLAHDVSVEMTAQLADVAIPDAADAGSPAKVAQTPVEPITTPVQPTSGTQTASSSVPAVVPVSQPPETVPVAPAKLLLKVLAGKKPIAATVYVRGKGAPQQVLLDQTARNPTPVMLPPGEYTVDVLSSGYLAQTRRVKLTRETEPTVAFTLAKAPAKKTQQVSVKNQRVELPGEPRFTEKQSTPKKDSIAGLALLVDLLVRDESLRLRVEGHTDNREGSAKSRQGLSESRAKAVAELLVSSGLDASRIVTEGLGDARPKAPNLTSRGRELNRRVEFVLLRTN